MAKNSIGLIELGSIAAGMEVADAMLKAADVELVLARSICSGKYMVMVRGEVAAVTAEAQKWKSSNRSASSKPFPWRP
jgi:microcompartment protein CcmL/EutN